jgi:two-component system, OmpR family, sensor kinase
MAIFTSVRGRLTLWYSGVLALVLVVFACGTYLYLARAAQQRTDRSLIDTANSFVSTFTTEANDEAETLSVAAIETAAAFRFPDRVAIVLDEQRQLVAASPLPAGFPPSDQWFSAAANTATLNRAMDEARAGGRTLFTLPSPQGELRAIVVQVRNGNRAFITIIAQPLREQVEALAQARRAFYLSVPLALLLAAIGGSFLARKSLAPVIAMRDQAGRITASNLNERLPVPERQDELGQLAVIFNELLARLDQSFERQRRFMADASHELRTPVAVIRGESEVALSRDGRSAQDYRQSLAIVHDESRRLARIVDDLFTLARADTGQYPFEETNLYLDDTVGECLRSVRSLSEQRQVSLQFQPPKAEMPFRGDENLICRMVLNLLDNSLKYTPAGGEVKVGVERRPTEYAITIADTGIGIPASAQPHIFERFYRAQRQPQRDAKAAGGAGLGLSIASWIAGVHRGRIELCESTDKGSIFIISLPIPVSS